MLKKRNVHFIGIGGIGMSAIAEILYSKGFTVSGSDITENTIIRRLKTVSYTHLTLPTSPHV